MNKFGDETKANYILKKIIRFKSVLFVSLASESKN